MRNAVRPRTSGSFFPAFHSAAPPVSEFVGLHRIKQTAGESAAERKEANGLMPNTETVLILPSETYAERAKHILEQAHIRSQVQRITTPQGCAFRLTAAAVPAAVYPLLSAARIPLRSS